MLKRLLLLIGPFLWFSGIPANGQGTALRFDGANDLVNFGNAPPVREHTVEAWVYPTSGNGQQVIVGQIAGPGEACSKGMALFILDGGVPAYELDAAGCGHGQWVTGEDGITGQWTHLAGTYDGDTMRFYVNGTLIGELQGASFDPSSWMTAGAVTFFDGSHQYFKGDLDEIRIWDYARSAEQIRETMYRPLVGTEPGLIGYWNFDEGSGQEVHDLTSSGITGVLGSSVNGESSDPTWVSSGVPFDLEPESNLLVYPQLALGGGFNCILFVTNLTNDAWRGEAQLDAGEWPADQSWTLDGTERTGESAFEIRLAPQETRKFVLGSTASARSGWLEIRGILDSTTAEIATGFFYNFISDNTLSASSGVAPATGGIAFRFPVERTSQINTGIAIRDTQTPINFYLYDHEGNLVQSFTLSFSGARFVDQLFDDFFSTLPLPEFVGSVQVESQLPFYLTVLRQELIPGATLQFQLTSIPATAVP